MADLEFKLLNSLLYSKNILLQGRLLSFERGELLLKSLSLCLLVCVVSLDLFFYPVQLVSQSLPCVLALHGEDTFKGFFLTPEDLHFFLMGVESFLQLPDGFVEV